MTEMDRKKLLKDAELFIMRNDEDASLIVDGAIKFGAELLADFAEEIVNNLDKAYVINRCELLIDFLKFLGTQKVIATSSTSRKLIIEHYEKSINSL